MPYQPQRFIHAANVRLDVPVSVYLSEQLTDELRHQLEDATLSSFDCVVENCIDRNADYLLLSGNVFVEADRSLRARLSLLNGFRRLGQHSIQVFVLPGDNDPAEAWRAIPEMPDNVQVCYSSSPEPISLVRESHTLATVSASMWYGETDAFGIRVIHSSPDGIEPFRIGTVSRAKFAESRRMARLTASTDESLIVVADNGTSVATESAHDVETEAADDYEAAFQSWMQKLMREGQMSYLALGSELQRTSYHLENGLVHCPGTTQPRSQLEADCGLCSLVIVDAAGHLTVEEINTSAVDWKNLSMTLRSGSDLNTLLEEMREQLLDLPTSASDQIWSICWTLTGPLPVLRAFEEEDVELAVAVELDQLDIDGQSVRLLHQVKMLPEVWELKDADHLAQQYADLLPETAGMHRSVLQALPEQAEITEGWTKRLTSLAGSVDRQRLLAQLLSDGADWFVSDLDELHSPEALDSVADEMMLAEDTETVEGDGDALVSSTEASDTEEAEEAAGTQETRPDIEEAEETADTQESRSDTGES